MADEPPPGYFKYLMVPGLIATRGEDGWRYATSWHEPEFRGPFRDVDEAARDFVATVGDQYAGLSRFGGSHGTMFADDMYELLDAIDAHMDARYGR